jgi:NADH dehydrogenase FAD-containing subunit
MNIEGHPMMAQPALQQGKLLGRNIVKLIQNKRMEPFEYNDKGSIATIGRNKAVVDLQITILVACLLGLFGCLCIYSR